MWVFFAVYMGDKVTGVHKFIFYTMRISAALSSLALHKVVRRSFSCHPERSEGSLGLINLLSVVMLRKGEGFFGINASE